MSAKQDILSKLRKVATPESELPPLEGPWQQFDDIDRHFADMVAAVGGVCHRVESWEQARRHLEQLPMVEQAGGLDSGHLRICSLVPELELGGVDLNAVDDPHDLADIDLAVIAGQFGVAENGAIWVTDGDVRQRVIFFLPQHLAIVLHDDALVHNMHEAYQRLTLPTDGGFGVFISGPSKTADIEQSLVIGAHGARSLTVLRVR